MLQTADFIHYVRSVSDSKVQAVLARLLLNSVYDRAAYPVDLSEVMGLPPLSESVAFAFLDACAARPRLYVQERDGTLDDFIKMVDGDDNHA